MEQKKKITLPIKVIIIGCIIGLVVAGIGGIKQLNAIKTNEDRRQAALKASEEAIAKANARLAEIEKEYNEVKTQYNAKVDEEIIITLENCSVTRYIYKLIKETFNVSAQIIVRNQKRFRIKQIYILIINEKIDFIKQALNLNFDMVLDNNVPGKINPFIKDSPYLTEEQRSKLK